MLISGPRQSEKTTLAADIASDDIPFLTLDDVTVLQSAIDNPVGFIRGLDRAVVDEVQRAPNLLLSIKNAVDEDTTPGRFLLTGSANIMTIPTAADSLASRMEVISLLPLSQAELLGKKSDFIDRAFAAEKPSIDHLIIGDKLIEAEHSGQLIKYTSIGNTLGLNHVTTRKYAGIFESIYLVHTLQPWFNNRLTRLIKSPKLHFLDSGLLAAMRDVSPDILRRDKTSFGPILETFVFSELQKIVTWSDQRCTFSHFRDKDKNEVDIVLGNRRGEIVGIEVKSSATVSPKDFSGMRKLAEASGKKFVQGLVLYDHDQVVPFADNMFAAPLSCLWNA